MRVYQLFPTLSPVLFTLYSQHRRDTTGRELWRSSWGDSIECEWTNKYIGIPSEIIISEGEERKWEMLWVGRKKMKERKKMYTI